MMTELGELAIDIVGAGAIARADEDYRWHSPLLGAPAAHIAGGSDEVMKNIIGERVLGLPGEPRVDKGVPWRDVLR
jgi:alkylation response protein AidB-like acyl-CoA dehydrogenase